MNKSFGQRIRELREAKDLSLRDLAKLLDVSAAFLSDVELGRRYPSEDTLGLYAVQLGVSVDELKEYDARPPVKEMVKHAEKDPAFGMALRSAMDLGLSAKELQEFIQKKKGQDLHK